MEKFLDYFKRFVIYAIVFLFPLFFLPFTQEFFITGKLYFLAFGALLLFLISSLQLLTSKKLSWASLPFDTPVVLFLITIALSTVVSSPNKIQALLNPNFGLVALFSLTVLYFYLSRNVGVGRDRPEKWTGRDLSLQVLSVSSVLLSILTIIFFFQPFKNANFPQSLQFLKNPNFTPMGSQLDLAIFLGFFVIFGISRVILRTKGRQTSPKPEGSLGLSEKSDIRQGSFANAQDDTKSVIFNFSFLIFNLVALSLTLYTLLARRSLGEGGFLQLPPVKLSWYAAIETLKNPLTALFGVGIDNFSSIFTRVKDFSYNQSPLWQINSFGISRSTILHIFSETGLFGTLAFGLLLLAIARVILSPPKAGEESLGLSEKSDIRQRSFANAQDDNNGIRIDANKFLIFYILFFILFFPPSLPTLFLLFVVLTQSSCRDVPAGRLYQPQTVSPVNNNVFDLSNLLPIYLGTAIISFAFIAGGGYLLSRSYAAEIYFKKGLDGFAKNDAKQVYDNMRQSIILNPYIEKFRINFSQTNLLLANNIASKKQEEITDQDKQNISQGIQAAIAEGKAATTLNPQKAGNWENLANVYRNILNVAQGADVWTISAYQRAIVSDPQNPIYRLNLGGVYYSLGNYEEAVKLFEQSIGLKPDWPNAHYNLAWALYQRKDYQRAASEMQNVSQLVDPKSEDAKKVQKDLEEFKKMLPEEEATAAGELKPGQLSLPTPPSATFSPKIKLPKEASPEAK